MGHDSAATGCHRPPNPQGHIGAPGCHLELHVAIWSSTRPPGPPNGHLELQMTTWSSKRPPGAPDGHLDLQMATWSSKRPPGAPNGHPELQTDTNNRRFLVQTKHILSEYNQIIDYTEILAMGFERGVIRIEHPQLGEYMFCNQMTSNRLSR